MLRPREKIRFLLRVRCLTSLEPRQFLQCLEDTPTGVNLTVVDAKPPRYLLFAAVEATSSFRAIATYFEVVPRVLEQAQARLDRDEVMGEILAAVEDGRRELDLSNRGLTELPPEISLARTVEVLNLAGNQFELLPASIGLLENLRTLDVSHNRLRRLPPHIGALSNLEVLIAHDNELFDLPWEIRLLSRLRQLDVANNRLSALPPGGTGSPPLVYRRLPGRSFADYERFIASVRNASVHQVLEQGSRISTVLDVADGRVTVCYDDELELLWSEAIKRNESLL